MRLRRHYIFLYVSFCSLYVIAQQPAKRYEIDAKRIGVAPEDKDALPRSREFVRLDSTYYVGYLYEGLYRYDRAADYAGYRQAIGPLRKALYLLEKDFGGNLRNLFSSFSYFQQYAGRFNDYYQLAFALKQCYNVTEMPDSTMALLDRIDAYDFQKDFFNTGCDRSWLFHRNRYFTSAKHPFLKNSLGENERLAYLHCYQQLGRIAERKQINDYWYGPRQSEEDYMTVYHYLALLHNYNRQYDSSEYYYRLLVDGRRVSWGNYGHLKEETGDFTRAREFFSRTQYNGEHALSEPVYYLPSLLVFAGQTRDAISMVQSHIAETGSTPGFGWYNLALARAYLYDGQVDSSEFYLGKASRFRELHINTTLTQEQYEFTVNLLRLQVTKRKMRLEKLFNRGWWYTPRSLYRLAVLQFRKIMTEYVLVNALADNPERKRLIYDLFCGESTVTFDEVLELLSGFSSGYFERLYQSYYNNDPRPNLRPYFLLSQSMFADERGKDREASALARKALALLREPRQDDEDPGRENEKLMIGRLLEILIRQKDKEAPQAEVHLVENYPQLVPFAGFRPSLKITLTGDASLTGPLTERMRSFNIDSDAGTPAMTATIALRRKGKTCEAVITSVSGSGKTVVAAAPMYFKTLDGVAEELLLRVYGKGGATLFEYEPVPEAQQPAHHS